MLTTYKDNLIISFIAFSVLSIIVIRLAIGLVIMIIITSDIIIILI